jgi:hypothetical protein
MIASAALLFLLPVRLAAAPCLAVDTFVPLGPAEGSACVRPAPGRSEPGPSLDDLLRSNREAIFTRITERIERMVLEDIARRNPGLALTAPTPPRPGGVLHSLVHRTTFRLVQAGPALALPELSVAFLLVP